MSFFEFILKGNLTDELKERTEKLLKDMNETYVPYVIHNYIDDISEDEKEKETKKRTLYIHSHTNIKDYLFQRCSNCELEMQIYYKQPVI